MNSVVHFEMPYGDAERVASFYHTAFGWETQDLGEKMGNYVLATTTESAPDRMPRHPGAINGGFFPKRSDMPGQHPSIVIAVDDIDEATDRVTRAGGRVLGEPMAIPDVGVYVSFVDPEGNRVAMLERSRDRGQREHERAEHNRPGASGGSRIGTRPEKDEQEWSPRHSTDQPAEGERDDSYGADGTRANVKKTPSSRKPSIPAAGKSGGRNKR